MTSYYKTILRWIDLPKIIELNGKIWRKNCFYSNVVTTSSANAMPWAFFNVMKSLSSCSVTVSNMFHKNNLQTFLASTWKLELKVFPSCTTVTLKEYLTVAPKGLSSTMSMHTPYLGWDLSRILPQNKQSHLIAGSVDHSLRHVFMDFWGFIL